MCGWYFLDYFPEQHALYWIPFTVKNIAGSSIAFLSYGGILSLIKTIEYIDLYVKSRASKLQAAKDESLLPKPKEQVNDSEPVLVEENQYQSSV